MAHEILTSAIAADAGLYREWIARSFRRYIETGGSLETSRRFNRHLDRLAALTGLPVLDVMGDLRADVEAMEEEA